VWLDSDFPKMLGAELYRPHPTYIAEMAIEPVVVHDFAAMPGQTVQLDRYQFWGSPGTKESRERTADQTIGTASGRNITKQKVNVTLREYTGPADPGEPDAPSTFKVSKQNIMTAQRLLIDTGNIGVFHQSIGSLTLLDDYRRWRDRVFINELYKAYANGRADGDKGGYYFPMGFSEAELNAAGGIGYDVSAPGQENQARFSVKHDLLEVVRDMRLRNVPQFPDGFYRCLCDPGFMTHMRQDKDFREVARYSGVGQPNPMAPWGAPNANLYLGSGPAYGQAGFPGGAPSMPVGVLFEGVRFFESTNVPEYAQMVSINGAIGFSGTTARMTQSFCGMFYGPQAVGLGTGGNNASVLTNSNDDFSRYIILIWQLYAGWELLNNEFVTIAHSFNYQTPVRP
jgi:hypothetical protein